MLKKIIQPAGIFLVICFLFYVAISWVLFFQDTRALLAISNFFPHLRKFLFTTQTLLMHYKLNTVPTLLFGLFAIGSFFFYFYSLKQNITLRVTIIFSLVFGFIIFFSYPALSSDIFSYIFSDRIATVYHQNVWTVAPITHDSDPFAIMADWKNTTSVYGEVKQLFYTIPSILGRNNVVLLVTLYKLMSSLFAAGIVFVFILLFKSAKEKENTIARNMRMVLWNPLFLLEIFGSGHNDSIMIFFTLLAYYFYRQKKLIFTGIALACAVQVKLIPILLFIFLLVSLLHKKAYKDSILFLVSFGFINSISFWLMGVSPFTFAQRVSYNAGVYWQSLPNLLRYMYSNINLLFSISFFVVLILLIIYQIRAKQKPLQIYAYSLLLYLFFFTTAYWNWYALWILTLIPLLQNARFRYFIIIFSFTSLMAYPLYWLSLRFNYQNIIWPIVTYLFLFILPSAILLFDKKKNLANQIARLD